MIALLIPHQQNMGYIMDIIVGISDLEMVLVHFSRFAVMLVVGFQCLYN